MPELLNFPMKSQRRSPDANQDFDCVATCIASALQYETGRDFEPNAVKDAVYGAGYVGGLSAANFASYAANQGVHLYPINGTPTGLVWSARQMLQQLHPGIFTEPDPYEPQPNLGWSHVMAWHKWDDHTLTAMDPWTGEDVTKVDAEWVALLQFGQIWVTEKLAPQLIVPTPDDLHDWSVYRKDVPLVTTHAIPQSWLRGKRHGLNFGPIMEQERAVQTDGITFMECRCSGAKASWNSKTGQVTWWTAHGPVTV